MGKPKRKKEEEEEEEEEELFFLCSFCEMRPVAAVLVVTAACACAADPPALTAISPGFAFIAYFYKEKDTGEKKERRGRRS